MVRPTPQVIESLLELVATGMSARSICERPGMPTLKTLMRWLEEETPEGDQLRQHYAHAKQHGADYMVDQILEIADNFQHGEDTPEAVNRARLQIDARKWCAAKLMPKKYGDRVIGEVGNVTIVVNTGVPRPTIEATVERAAIEAPQIPEE